MFLIKSDFEEKPTRMSYIYEVIQDFNNYGPDKLLGFVNALKVGQAQRYRMRVKESTVHYIITGQKFNSYYWRKPMKDIYNHFDLKYITLQDFIRLSISFENSYNTSTLSELFRRIARTFNSQGIDELKKLLIEDLGFDPNTVDQEIDLEAKISEDISKVTEKTKGII